MNKLCSMFLLIVLLVSQAACKKETKSQIPSALMGKWYVRQYTTTSSSDVFSETPYTVRFSDTATNVYYQFNNDGTGLEQYSADPNFVIVPPAGFNYKVSGNSIDFSKTTPILMATTCTFEMPTSNTLILRDTYSYTSAGIVINNKQQITLSK